jgi:predicted transcriptional regulator
MITPEQIRGARAMLGLTQAELAKRAGISTTGLNNVEGGDSDPRASTLRAIQQALESVGVEFTNGGGVRLRPIDADKWTDDPDEADRLLGIKNSPE